MIEELFNFINNQYKKNDRNTSSIISALDDYGKYFEPFHSQEIVKMYTDCLDSEMYIASNRQMYVDVIRKLKQLVKFEGRKKAALQLKEKWIKTYKKRSAMKDELEKFSATME